MFNILYVVVNDVEDRRNEQYFEEKALIPAWQVRVCSAWSSYKADS